MQATREQLKSIITESFDYAHRQVHARNLVKQLVGAVAKYFPHVSHNQTINTRDIALKSLPKAILATDYQPIPKYEGWTLHKHALRSGLHNYPIVSLGGSLNREGERQVFPEMVVTYSDTEDGLYTANLDSSDGWVLNTAESLKNVKDYIRLFSEGNDKVYNLGGHVPSVSSVAIMETVLVYLQALPCGDGPGEVKVGSCFVNSAKDGVMEMDSIRLTVDDQANNLFVRIGLYNLS